MRVTHLRLKPRSVMSGTETVVVTVTESGNAGVDFTPVTGETSLLEVIELLFTHQLLKATKNMTRVNEKYVFLSMRELHGF